MCTCGSDCFDCSVRTVSPPPPPHSPAMVCMNNCLNAGGSSCSDDGGGPGSGFATCAYPPSTPPPSPPPPYATDRANRGLHLPLPPPAASLPPLPAGSGFVGLTCLLWIGVFSATAGLVVLSMGLFGAQLRSTMPEGMHWRMRGQSQPGGVPWRSWLCAIRVAGAPRHSMLTFVLLLLQLSGAMGQCTNTCNYAWDNECNDGGPGARYADCELGTDCGDCILGVAAPADGADCLNCHHLTRAAPAPALAPAPAPAQPQPQPAAIMLLTHSSRGGGTHSRKRSASKRTRRKGKQHSKILKRKSRRYIRSASSRKARK